MNPYPVRVTNADFLMEVHMSQIFRWELHPEAEKFVDALIAECVAGNAAARAFESQLADVHVRLRDIVDYISLSGKSAALTVTGLGYAVEVVSMEGVVYRHYGADLPKIRIYPHHEGEPKLLGLAVRCDSVTAFAQKHACASIEGTPGGYFSKTRVVSPGDRIWFCAVERRGVNCILPIYAHASILSDIEEARRIWNASRFGQWSAFNAPDGVEARLAAVRRIKEFLHEDLARAVIFEEERAYWQSRNESGQFQKVLQDQVGIGWANSDHHTFRSSRQCFRQLIQLFLVLGFVPRERFYAGDDAGWGAQVLEAPDGLVVFADVDLMPEEKDHDFAEHPLAPGPKLGTIGLWCALHGESILEAGMHHLEIKCDFQAKRAEEERSGRRMLVFNDSPELKQAFTAGARWAVSEARLQDLASRGLITPEQARVFAETGAIGSHLEILERAWGYKGFKKAGISQIISSTDPRKQ
jgi:hypothetical protein